MRAGISTVQQTLTPEAAVILKRAIADAQRRGHAQVTPLHVASSLLSSPSSMLQQACIQSHRHVPHPLQCRALDLCFNVALDRLPATLQHQQQTSLQIQNSNPSQTSLSNALVAALKRAQAHQRRGCPEQQQVPLLAVKVEMEQLVISILDDPSVSRVMREAGFSSTRAKNSLEACSNARGMITQLDEIRSRIDKEQHVHQIPRMGICGPRSNPDTCKSQEVVSAVTGVLTRNRRQRNPILLGEERSTSFLLKEVGTALSSQDSPIQFRCCRVLFVDPGFGSSKEITQRWMLEIAKAEESSSPVVVVLGDLSWCMEQTAAANALLGELGRILEKAESKRFWYVGAASSQCYMRFLAQYPSMESRLGFQPLPISVGSIRPRFSLGQRTLPKMPFRLPEEDWEELTCCSECTAKFEQESMTFLQEQQSRAESAQSTSSTGDSRALPFWMRTDTCTKPPVTPAPPPTRLQTQEFMRELRRKWNRTCQSLHASKTMPSLIDTNSSSSQTSSPDDHAVVGKASSWLSLSTVTQVDGSSTKTSDLTLDKPAVPAAPASPKITTELVLGSTSDFLKLHHERVYDKDGCTARTGITDADSKPGGTTRIGVTVPNFTSNNNINVNQEVRDLSSLYKSIVKGLRERVPWQGDAAGKVASTVVSCRSGERRRGVNVKGDAWILFTGPDCMGKLKLAKALAELVFGEDSLVVVSLNPSQGRNTSFKRSMWRREGSLSHCTEFMDLDGCVRGKTMTDRIAEALKSKPFSVVLLEDYDKADVSVRRSLVRSMQRGKIQHSSGREVGFGNAIIVLTSNTRKGDLEERMECAEDVGEASLRVIMDKVDGDYVKNNNNTGEVVILDSDKSIEPDMSTGIVGEKRKRGWRWEDKLESLFDSRSTKKLGLDLNLGLLPGGGSESLTWERLKGGGTEGGEKAFDEVVEFQEPDVELIARTALEKLERVARGCRVNVEIDVRVVEKIVAGVWSDTEASFERWIQETVESTASACEGSVLRIVGGLI